MQQNNFNFTGTYYQPPKPNNELSQMAYYQQKRDKEKSELIKTGVVIGSAIMAYLIIQTVLSLFIAQGELKEIYQTSPLFQNCFSMIAVHFCSLFIPFSLSALILKKNFTAELIPLKKNPKSISFAWVCAGMGLCIGANYFVNLVILICKHFGYELTQGDVLKPNDIFSCISLVFAIAIVPAIIEEYALRCCTLGVLRKYGKGFAIFTVSVVFGLLHGNVIQFLFAFLIGLVLAYVTVKTDNIIPAVLIHGFNNGISVLNDILAYAANKNTAENVLTIVYIVWGVLAIIGIIYLLFKKELLPKKEEKQPKEPYALSFGVKLACLIPGFALPFVMLIVITLTTIQKI